jgi:SWI/SNF-related matrix-associated actin-dependent regulator of chromatin subfamily B protein 1
MKLSSVDPQTGAIVKADANGNVPESSKLQYIPRIKCNDCPGKVYNPGQGQTADGFETHLKNRLHKERVEARRKGEK